LIWKAQQMSRPMKLRLLQCQNRPNDNSRICDRPRSG
jgi:hypothetical protein